VAQRSVGVELDLRGELLTPAQVSGLEDSTLDLGLLRPPFRRPGLTVEPCERPDYGDAVDLAPPRSPRRLAATTRVARSR
jgi:hypothetical protein